MKETREEICAKLAQLEQFWRKHDVVGRNGAMWLVSTVRVLLAENGRLHADLRRLDPHYGQSPEDREAEFSEHLWAALGGGGEAPKRRPLA